MTIHRVPSLVEICSKRMNSVLIEGLDNAPYCTAQDITSVANAILNSYQVQSQTATEKKTVINIDLFFEVFESSQRKRSSQEKIIAYQRLKKRLEKIFRFYLQVKNFTDPDNHINESIKNVYYSLVPQTELWATRVKKMSTKLLGEFLEKPDQRGLIGNRQTIFCPSRRLDSSEARVAFNLHQILGKHDLLGLRNFNYYIFSDFHALTWIFDKYPRCFKNYEIVLQNHSCAIAAAIIARAIEIHTVLEYSNKRAIALFVINQRVEILKYLECHDLNDFGFLQLAIALNPKSFLYASKYWQEKGADEFLYINPNVFQFLDESKRDDSQLTSKVLRRNGELLKYASTRLQDSEDVVEIAVTNCAKALKFASERIQNDKKIVALAIKDCGRALEFASTLLRDDKEIVLLAIENHPNSMRFASKTLQLDEEIFAYLVQSAAKSLNLALPPAPDSKGLRFSELKGLISQLQDKSMINKVDDFALMHSTIQKNSTAFLWASKRLQKNGAIIQACLENYRFSLSNYSYFAQTTLLYTAAHLSQDGLEIQYLHEGDRNDKTLALSAVQSDGRALQFLSQKLQDDFDIVERAIGSSEPVFQYASSRLQKNPQLLSKAIKSTYLNYVGLNPLPKINPALMMECFRQSESLLAEFFSRLCDNEDIALQMVSQRGVRLELLSDRLKLSKRVVEVALQNDPEALEFASDEIKGDLAIVEMALKSRKPIFKFAAPFLQNNLQISLKSIDYNEENYFALAVRLQKNPLIICRVLKQHSEFFWENREHIEEECQIPFLIELVKRDIWSFFKATNEQQDDVQLCLTAIKKDPFILEHLSARLMSSKDFVTAACAIEASTIKFAAWSLRSDLKFMLKLAKSNLRITRYLLSSQALKQKFSMLVQRQVLNNCFTYIYKVLRSFSNRFFTTLKELIFG